MNESTANHRILGPPLQVYQQLQRPILLGPMDAFITSAFEVSSIQQAISLSATNRFSSSCPLYSVES